MKVKIIRVEETHVPKKILNTVRGRGKNTTERAAKLMVSQCREERRANRVSWVIKTKDFSVLEKDDNRPKRTHRTMLWP